MGNQQSIQKINFEDIRHIMYDDNFVIINTLPVNKQHCLISNTISAEEENTILNELLKSNITKKIIVYGENSCDDSVFKKCKQLQSLGFLYVYQYVGGLFEWLLLQDIYGSDLFTTTTEEIEHLKYRGNSHFTTKRITSS